MTEIIMVCTGNTCRSPMAEALMRDALKRAGVSGVTVSSAGVFASPGGRASAEAVQEMARRGLDISGHRSRNLMDAGGPGAIYLGMTRSHVDSIRRALPGAKADTLMNMAGLHGEIGDPYGRGLAAYRAAADLIAAATEKIAIIMKERGGK